MNRLAILLAATAAGAALGPAAAGAATTVSHTALWQNHAGTVACGVESPALSRKFVLCGARGVPRPPHSSPSVGDPFVSLQATGPAKLVLISQNSYPPNAKTRTLASGAGWSSRGVTCHLSTKTVLCFNSDNHGFVIGGGHYRSF